MNKPLVKLMTTLLLFNVVFEHIAEPVALVTCTAEIFPVTLP
jgi:hypothetical protein